METLGESLEVRERRSTEAREGKVCDAPTGGKIGKRENFVT
jgi:hypothetical protein